MQYKENPKNGDKLSVLAYGCMRLPQDDGEVSELITRAIVGGVNYFDTAYVYPGKEAALGRALKHNGMRDRVRIATKLPPFLVGKQADAERILNTQLGRLQTNRIDYYMIHMLPDVTSWHRMTDIGLNEWLSKKKADGTIANIGFSYHGGARGFQELLDAYAWDFCMLQYNFMDEHTQAGRAGLMKAASMGLPVMVMEPLRGGRLAAERPKAVMDIWAESPVRRSPAEWSFRWLWDQPEVTTVLSGMKDMRVLESNLKAADAARPGCVTEAERGLYERVAAVLRAETKVPCSGCGYCMPCPAGVDIPQCFDNYNAEANKLVAQYWYAVRTYGRNAGRCMGCGTCERHCPQGIHVREELNKVKRELEGILYRPMMFVVKKAMKRN